MPGRRKHEATVADQTPVTPAPVAFDPNSQEFIQARRERDARRKAEAVKAREQLLAEAVAGPEDRTDDVLVAKVDARAARAEQERLDAGKEAADGQQPEPPPPPPPEEGVVPPELHPKHPPVPGPEGSSPHSGQLPAGPQDADVVYVTDDIDADGTPLVQGAPAGFVEPSPQIDGENDKEYPSIPAAAEQGGPVDDDGNLEPIINQHSEEGARLDELKLQRPVVYVPNAATLDPKSGNNTL